MRASQTRIPREQPGEWCANGPPCVKEVPGYAELEGWISERNCDLRNALEFGNAGTITQIGTLLSHGIAQLSRDSKDVVMDGQSMSSLMESVIEESDAKRRLVHVGAVPPVRPGEPSVRVRSARVGPLQSMPVHCRQWEWSPAVTRFPIWVPWG